MPTNFPTSVDNFTNPTANDSLNLPSHSTQHANANDAIEAIEGYLLNGGQGLTLIRKQTIGTAVASQTLSDIFSSTYDNYRVLVSGGVASAANLLAAQVGGVTSGYKSGFIYTTWSAGVTSQQSASTSRFFLAGAGMTTGLTGDFDLQSPFLATHTTYNSRFAESAFGGGISSGVLPTNTSYTSLTVSIDAGTMTGGTIYVYGYSKGQ